MLPAEGISLVRPQRPVDAPRVRSPDSATIQSGCKCCGVTATRQLEVPLRCPAGGSLYHTFTVPDGCACSKCSSSSSALESSSSAGALWQQSTGEDWAQQRQTGGDGLPWPDPAGSPWDSAGDANPWDPAGGASPRTCSHRTTAGRPGRAARWTEVTPEKACPTAS